MYITTGAVFTQYAKSLHVSEFGFGLLAAMPFLGALVQLPTSYVLERYGHRKSIFIAVGIVHRLTWLAIAAIPWFFPMSWWPGALILLIGFSGLCGHIITPSWVSWMADLVPTRIRGRYFSRRTQIGQFVGVLVTICIGFALDHAKVVSPEYFLKVISLLLVVAGLAGSVDFLMFLKVPDLDTPKNPNVSPNLRSLYLEPLKNRNFRHFLGFTGTLTFSIGYIGQFIWLYLFDVVKTSNTRANVMLVVMPLIVMMIFFPIWGRLVDRLGRKPVLIISGLLMVHGGAAWIFVNQENWWLGYIAAMLATAAWPGIEVGNFNLLLNMTVSKKGRARQGSVYSAINSLVVAVAGVLSGLFGGLVAYYLKDWHGSFWGWPLTYHSVLFLTSTVLRLASLGWLIGLEDPEAHTTRRALRYMISNIYSNVQQAIFMPTRQLTRIGKMSWKLNFVRSKKSP
jgi:MFS family permease